MCFFTGYTSRANEGERRESPIGKRSWVNPSREMERKALEPTPGQIQSTRDSPKPQEPVSRVHCGHCDAERSGLDEALKPITAQLRVLNTPLEKHLPMWLFLVRAGGSGCFSNQAVSVGRWRLGTGTMKGCGVPGVRGSVRGVMSNNINQTNVFTLLLRQFQSVPRPCGVEP